MRDFEKFENFKEIRNLRSAFFWKFPSHDHSWEIWEFWEILWELWNVFSKMRTRMRNFKCSQNRHREVNENYFHEKFENSWELVTKLRCLDFNPQYWWNFSVGIFQDFNWIFSVVKSDLKDNRSPDTVACAVIPRLGRLALWMIGLVPRLFLMLCEQIVNADQSLMDDEILGAIYLGKKKTSSLGTNSFSCNEACYPAILP